MIAKTGRIRARCFMGDFYLASIKVTMSFLKKMKSFL